MTVNLQNSPMSGDIYAPLVDEILDLIETEVSYRGTATHRLIADKIAAFIALQKRGNVGD